MSSRHLLVSVIVQALTGLVAVVSLIYVLLISGQVVNIERNVRKVETSVRVIKEVVPSNSNPHGRPGPAGQPARWPFPQLTLLKAL